MSPGTWILHCRIPGASLREPDPETARVWAVRGRSTRFTSLELPEDVLAHRRRRLRLAVRSKKGRNVNYQAEVTQIDLAPCL